jgi:hypothetical protein
LLPDWECLQQAEIHQYSSINGLELDCDRAIWFVEQQGGNKKPGRGSTDRAKSGSYPCLRSFFAIYFSFKVCLIHKTTSKEWFFML